MFLHDPRGSSGLKPKWDRPDFCLKHCRVSPWCSRPPGAGRVRCWRTLRVHRDGSRRLSARLPASEMCVLSGRLGRAVSSLCHLHKSTELGKLHGTDRSQGGSGAWEGSLGEAPALVESSSFRRGVFELHCFLSATLWASENREMLS